MKHPVVGAALRFAKAEVESGGAWVGTAVELLKALTPFAEDPDPQFGGWPVNARTLAWWLNRSKTHVAQEGLLAETGWVDGRKVIRLRWKEEGGNG